MRFIENIVHARLTLELPTTRTWNFHQRHGGGKKKYFIFNKRKYNCIIYHIYYIKESFSFYSIHYTCKISNKNDQLVTLTALVVLVLRKKDTDVERKFS